MFKASVRIFTSLTFISQITFNKYPIYLRHKKAPILILPLTLQLNAQLLLCGVLLPKLITLAEIILAIYVYCWYSRAFDFACRIFIQIENLTKRFSDKKKTKLF